MKILLAAALCLASLSISAQVPLTTAVQILRYEDARRYDASLEALMRSPNSAVRERAALAAGRIGKDDAIPALALLLNKDSSQSVRAMAAFAIGEIESVKGADAINAAILAEAPTRTGPGNAHVFARAVEAAGKIAAANAKTAESASLSSSILFALKSQPADREAALMTLTAALRARPDGGAALVAKFLTSPDTRIRGDALNTLARLRAKEELTAIRLLLDRDADAVVRADRKSTRLNSSHIPLSRMPSSA